ncbi:MAG TPA: hypothetical protein VGQ11_12555 [Candidatus Acidoferrales bacterium]|jgi:hypothetical protein|nr:hypothetical protein [Candidatus Acidoferrales bacterium]
MPGWAKQIAEQIKQQEELRRQEERQRQERAKLFSAKAVHLWRDFVAVLERDLEEFNQVLEHDARGGTGVQMVHQRGPGTRFRARRGSVTHDQFEVWLEVERQTIEYRLNTRDSKGAADATGQLRLKINDADEISILHDDQAMNFDQASEFLLRPLLASSLGKKSS